MKSTSKEKFRTVEEYFSAFPDNVREILEGLRTTIRQAAPGAEEIISYNMPAFRQNGMLVFYAAYREHIGFYPTASPIRVFKDELKDYKTSKGAIQFPIGKRIPTGLVKKIVKFKLKENLEKTKMKRIKQK